MAADSTIVVEIMTGIALFIYIGLQLQAIPDIARYKELYKLMNRDVYKFEPHAGHSAIFRKYDYDIDRVEFGPVSECIIFFPDGDIKLNDNLYIWKSTMVGNLIRWYYHRKFIKLKDEKIDIYNWRELRERYSQQRYDDYVRQYGGTTTQAPQFKFFRG